MRSALIVVQVGALLLLGAVAVGDEPAPSAVRRGPDPLVAAQGQKVHLLAYDNGDASPWVEFFAFDSPGHPKLVQLRKEQKLDELIKDAKTDMDRAMALKRWVGSLWKFTTPEPATFSDWSAVALLARAKQGKYGWCGQAAMLFQQACLAVGLPARFIELGRPDSPACHFTTEVYLREHGKWAVVDATPLPECDLYYAVNGVPQTALEMHRRVVARNMQGVSEVHPGGESKVEGQKQMAWGFYYVRWLTRCDVVTNTPKFYDLENVFDRRWHTVDWTDPETIPWEKQNHSVFWIRNERLSAWTTSDPEVMYWKPTDRVRMALRPGEKHVFAQLWSADLDFGYFEVAIDGRPWERLPQVNINNEPKFGWSAKRFSIAATPGVHEARVRSVSRTGAEGPEGFVRLRVD